MTATSATKELALAVENWMDSDCFETRENGDIITVALANKGKGVDPREYGGALYDPDSMLVLAGTTSTGGSDSIELVDVQRDKGENVDPEESGNGTVEYYEPGPGWIAFYDHGAMSSQKRVPLLQSFLQSFRRTRTTDGLHYDPSLPRLSWYPKISPYRFMVFSIPLAIGTVKAVLSYKGSVTTPITLEWISSVVIFLM